MYSTPKTVSSISFQCRCALAPVRFALKLVDHLPERPLLDLGNPLN
jgi:hypothetical protein